MPNDRHWLCRGLARLLVVAASVGPMVAHAAGSDPAAQGEEQSASERAAALGIPDPGRLPVIQNRKYVFGHELMLGTGVFPADPYYKGVIGRVGYTVHFSDNWAWEVGQYTYSYNVKTSLRKKLAQMAAARGNEGLALPEIEWVIASHAVLKPMYGKEALFNTRIVHLEGYLQAGPAAVKRSAPLDGVYLGLSLGAGLRLWMSEIWSLRLDLGDLVYVEDGATTEIQQAMQIGLGLSANLRGED